MYQYIYILYIRCIVVITPTKSALFEFGMIKEGDRLLLGLSGGKVQQ